VWKGWSPSRKLAAVVLLVAVVVAGAALAAGGRGGSAAAHGNASATTGGTAGEGSSTGSGGNKGSTSSTTAVTTPPVSLPDKIQVSRTTGLHAGDLVTITVRADQGSQIFAVEMRQCRGGSTINNGGDWLPTVAGKCAPTLGEGYKAVPGAPPFTSVTATYKVGTGSDTYKLDDGTSNTVTCDASHPCVLAVKYQIPNGFGFRTYPLTFS
jgi:hypothetical protein